MRRKCPLITHIHISFLELFHGKTVRGTRGPNWDRTAYPNMGGTSGRSTEWGLAHIYQWLITMFPLLLASCIYSL